MDRQTRACFMLVESGPRRTHSDQDIGGTEGMPGAIIQYHSGVSQTKSLASCGRDRLRGSALTAQFARMLLVDRQFRCPSLSSKDCVLAGKEFSTDQPT